MRKIIMLDFILVLAFLYFLLLGIYRGFLNLVFKFVGFFSGIFIGIAFYKPFSSILSSIFSASSSVVNFLSFLLIILAVVGFSLIIEKMLKRFIYKKKYVKLGDRVLGGVLGIFVFITCILFLANLKEKNEIANTLLSKSQIVSFISKSNYKN
ncbi:CvpA family protein [Sulfurihydrogenibium azorense]